MSQNSLGVGDADIELLMYNSSASRACAMSADIAKCGTAR